jgi:hypothetical protein
MPYHPERLAPPVHVLAEALTNAPPIKIITATKDACATLFFKFKGTLLQNVSFGFKVSSALLR